MPTASATTYSRRRFHSLVGALLMLVLALAAYSNGSDALAIGLAVSAPSRRSTSCAARGCTSDRAA